MKGRPVAIRWKLGRGGGSFAVINGRRTGGVYPLHGGKWWRWYMPGASFRLPSYRGRTATEAGAKSALRRAYRRR